MDDAFGNLDDINDEQALESLFESSSTFPNVSILGDGGISGIIARFVRNQRSI